MLYEEGTRARLGSAHAEADWWPFRLGASTRHHLSRAAERPEAVALSRMRPFLVTHHLTPAVTTSSPRPSGTCSPPTSPSLRQAPQPPLWPDRRPFPEMRHRSEAPPTRPDPPDEEAIVRCARLLSRPSRSPPR